SRLEDSRVISNVWNGFSSPLELDSSASSSSLRFPTQNRSLETWVQLKNHLQADQSKANGAVNSEATAVTTKALPTQGGHSFVGGGATGKVGKKRSRASRRAPTTLLSTDTSNFRAMVQQFTGIPESPYASQGRSFYHFTPPQHNYYSSFLFQDRMNTPPFFLPRVPPPSLNPSAAEDFGLNPVFSGPLMLPHLGISDSLIK
ncbi:hypothetical protein KI387_024446, partial [Taxus chinensis]